MMQPTALQDRRGLRFSFEAAAEIVPETPPEPVPARVTELSFRGCFLETTARLAERQRVRVRIFHPGESFEAMAHVKYVRPGGVGLLFEDMETHYRTVLQTWILAALDKEAKSNHL